LFRILAAVDNSLERAFGTCNEDPGSPMTDDGFSDTSFDLFSDNFCGITSVFSASMIEEDRVWKYR
jgi:hypothetical protein